MINRFKVYDGEGEVSDFDSTVKLATDNDIIDLSATKIYGIRKGDIAKIKDDSGWVELFDLIRTTIKDIVVTENFASVLADYSSFHNFGFSLSRNLEELKAAGFATGTHMATFLDAYAYMEERSSDRAEAINAIAGRVGYRINEATPEYDLDAIWKAVTTQYPLIDLVDDHKMRGGYYSSDNDVGKKNFAALMQYISAIDLAAFVEEETAAE